MSKRISSIFLTLFHAVAVHDVDRTADESFEAHETSGVTFTPRWFALEEV